MTDHFLGGSEILSAYLYDWNQDGSSALRGTTFVADGEVIPQVSASVVLYGDGLAVVTTVTGMERAWSDDGWLIETTWNRQASAAVSDLIVRAEGEIPVKKRAVLLGPIEYWWGERFNTTQARDYRVFRDTLSAVLVQAGFLVYRPYEAFKGEWDGNDGDECAQAVNDAAISMATVCIDMTPDGVPSDGTDKELEICRIRGKVVVPAPPPGPHVPIGPYLVEVVAYTNALLDEMNQAAYP